ncbi:MAG: hypothetical protein QM651_17890 [Rhodoblastus sp.]
MSDLPVFEFSVFDAESVAASRGLLYDGDVAEFVDARWRATFRNPLDPRDIIADFITGGACEVSAFGEATDDGHHLVTFSFLGPPGAFKGISGKVSTELMRMDGATAINVAIVTVDVAPSSTLPVEMRL